MTCCSHSQHAALKSSQTWAELPILGYQQIDGLETLELKNCPVCQSTLAVSVCVSLATAKRCIVTKYRDTFGVGPSNDFDLDAAARALMAQELRVMEVCS